MTHGQIPPEVKGKRVLIVDFCFPREQLIEMIKVAEYLVVLDHHISVERDLVGLEAPNFEFVFDVTRSGAQIAWDYVYPQRPRPWFVEVIADRDLWKWSLPYSKAVSKTLFVKNYYSWECLEQLYNIPADKITQKIRKFEKIGQVLLDLEEKEIMTICSKAICTELTTPTGGKYRVMLVSCSSSLRSDVGNRLASGDCDFAALWVYDFILDEWWISLRGSKNNSLDLSKISSEFDRGGGHEKAAGFAIFGSKGQNLHTYFKILEVPHSRQRDGAAARARSLLLETDTVIDIVADVPFLSS